MRNEPSRVAGFGAAFLRGIIRASRRQAGSPPLPTQESLPLHTGFAVLWQKPAFYGHPTLSTWFTSEYQKSGKKLVLGNTGAVTVVKFENGIKHILTAPRSLGHNIVCAYIYWPRSA